MTETQSNLNNPEQIKGLIDNEEPIAADDPAYEQIFKELQGGILKNYGRKYSLYIFIQFEQDKDKVKQWVRDEIADSVTSTSKQLEDTKTYREMRESDSTYSGELCKNFFLSYKGYKALFGCDPANPRNKDAKFDDIPFKDGMKTIWERSYRLEDSDVQKGCTNVPKDDDCWYNPPEEWDLGGNDEDQIHALILLAHHDLEELKNEANTTINKVQQVGEVLACEAGNVLRDTNGQAIGPFGFADGISQPLFLKADYEKYSQNHDTEQWDPKASLNLVLVKDPFGKEYSYGSYYVFQKLETNYELFQKKVDELAKKLTGKEDKNELEESDRERASALVVGRFKNGTPLALSDQPNQKGDRNSFNYADDPNGIKCPLHAHMRKVNPRQDDGNKPDLAEERRRKRRIFRAGITYFDPPQQNAEFSISQLCLNKLDYLNEVSKQPLETNIPIITGLLFVCFQSSISDQFSTQQRLWADERKFPFPRKNEQGDSIYLDPLIGHPLTTSSQECPKPQKWTQQWDSDKKDPYLFYGSVRIRGGEFFFAPSISFFKNLSSNY